VGVQVNELPATAGAWATAVLALIVVRTRPPHERASTWTGLVLFILWCLGPPLITGHLPTATGLARLADFLLIPGAAVAVSSSSPAALRRVGAAAAAALSCSVLVAGLQHFGLWPEPAFFSSLSWTRLGFSRVYELAPGEADRFMGGGLLFHRLKFANVTAVMGALFAGVAVLKLPGWRLHAFFALVALAGVTFFPYARAAEVSAVLSVAVVWWAGARRRTLAALGVGALLTGAVLAIFLVPSLHARFASSLSAQDSGERGSLTRAGLNAIATSPVVGIGLDVFKPGDYLPPDAPAQAREHPGKAHNQLVTIAAEAGLPAAFILLVTLIGWLLLGLRSLPEGALLVGAATVFGLLCVLHDPLFHAEASLALMLGLGVGLGAVERGVLQVSAALDAPPAP
jgi:O-antigen ligase